MCKAYKSNRGNGQVLGKAEEGSDRMDLAAGTLVHGLRPCTGDLTPWLGLASSLQMAWGHHWSPSLPDLLCFPSSSAVGLQLMLCLAVTPAPGGLPLQSSCSHSIPGCSSTAGAGVST